MTQQQLLHLLNSNKNQDKEERTQEKKEEKNLYPENYYYARSMMGTEDIISSDRQFLQESIPSKFYHGITCAVKFMIQQEWINTICFMRIHSGTHETIRLLVSLTQNKTPSIFAKLKLEKKDCKWQNLGETECKVADYISAATSVQSNYKFYVCPQLTELHTKDLVQLEFNKNGSDLLDVKKTSSPYS